MTSMTDRVTGGVDTHLDVHVAAALSQLGALLGTRSFPATTRGYRQLLKWLHSFGEVELVGVEGTGSYGAGLTRHLLAESVRVVEVDRPNVRTVAGAASPTRSTPSPQLVPRNRVTRRAQPRRATATSR